jgi:hypothetical protein
MLLEINGKELGLIINALGRALASENKDMKEFSKSPEIVRQCEMAIVDYEKLIEKINI